MARVLARQFCQLQSSHAESSPQGSLPPSVLGRGISTPLRVEAWEQALADHPHKEWVLALLRGMRQGFRIGLRSSAQCRSSVSSHPSARVHSQVVGEFLQQQVAAGFMMGPFEPQECSGVVTSSVGVVPKSTPGKFRVIVDLSRPEGASVNDQLLRELTHVAYSSIEDASLAMHALGQGAQLAKIDIRDAYRIIPVHPEDRPFLALSWQDRVYIDCQLPFGLASAPAIFSAVAEALEWILRRRGVRGVLHYLDDFLLMGAPGSHECSHVLATTFSTCEELGVPWPWTRSRAQQPASLSLVFAYVLAPCQCRSQARRSPPFAVCCRSSFPPSVYVTCRRWSHWLGTWFMRPRCALLPSPFWAGFSRCLGGPGQASPDGLTLLPEPIWLGGIPSSPTGRVSPHTSSWCLGNPTVTCSRMRQGHGAAVLGCCLFGSKCPGLKTTACHQLL